MMVCAVLGATITSITGQTNLDSLQRLPEVVVTAKSYKEVIPAQKLTGKELKTLNSFSVADAIRYFSGIQIKDYGGIGGLKTVNIRSMGTHHVGIFYDGIQLGNAQNGQIDLGKFSLDNIDEIAVYNGQKSDIFQSAKDFGSSGSVYLRSRRPSFEPSKTLNLKAVVKTGSFDLINPSVLIEKRLSNDISVSANAEYIGSSGKYKYRYKRVLPSTKEVLYDTTAIRENGDIHSVRAEAGIYGMIPSGYWQMKAYAYSSERGIPGAIVNNRWMNSQRQWDRNFFVQGTYQQSLNNRIDLMVNGKYANDYMRYLNPDTTLMYIDNAFLQQETYLSVASKYRLNRQWDAALSTDLQYNWLTSDMAGFVFPKRLTTLIALATAADYGKFKLQGSLLVTLVNERISSGNVARDDTVKAAPNKYQFTPAFFVSYKPFDSHNLNIRAFYKNIFRMPTFNDLYYTDIGNINLKPEFTHQYNVGVQYDKTFKQGWLKALNVQADGYFNQVTNKIVAIPKGSGQYRWMMMNYGYVEIRGVDVAGGATVEPIPDWFLNLRLTYTYQKAQDFTKRKSEILQKSTYGGQIAYIPWHSGSVVGSLAYRSWQLNYSFIYVGERYHSSANVPTEYEQPWYTNDLALIKTFSIKGYNMRLSAEVNNLLNQDYEVVLNYPMPKRNYKFTLTVEL